jgi:hypothetical protein
MRVSRTPGSSLPLISEGQPWTAAYIDSIGQPEADLRSDIAAEHVALGVDRVRQVEELGLLPVQQVAQVAVSHPVDELGRAAPQQHPDRLGDDLQVGQLLGGDVEQHAAPLGVVLVPTLGEVAHGGGELSVGATELLEQCLGEVGVGAVDADLDHELLVMGEHRVSSGCGPDRPTHRRRRSSVVARTSACAWSAGLRVAFRPIATGDRS